MTLQVPKGTADVLGEQAAAREALEARAAAILQGAGYERIETPTLEATELFARGVGAATDIVQKEMYTLTDGGGRRAYPPGGDTSRGGGPSAGPVRGDERF